MDRSSRVRKEGSTPLLVIHAAIISSHLISSPIAQYVMRQYTQRALRELDGTSCTKKLDVGVDARLGSLERADHDNARLCPV